MVQNTTNSNARVLVREAKNQTKVHEYTPINAKVTNNGRKKPDEIQATLMMQNKANIGDTIDYVEDYTDLTYCDAIWNFQLSCRDERGFHLDINSRAYNSIECNGVLAGDNCFINGIQYLAVNGTKGNNTQFDMSGTDEQTAADLADSINNDTRVGTLKFDIVGVLGTGVDADKINLYALPSGTAGNSITLTSNDGARLTLGGATFFNGTDADLPNTRFTQATNGKFQGNYQLTFDLTGQKVTIPIEGQAYQTGNGQGVRGRWNLDGQFDINVWFSPELIPGIGNSTPVVWSQYDGSYGLDIGMYEDGTTGNWYLRVRYGFGSGETILLGTTAKVFEEGVSDQTPRHVRVCRGGDDIIRLYAMGSEDATASIAVASSLENPAGRNDMYFGSDHTDALEFAGHLHQVKLYSGATLTEDQYLRMIGGKAQPIHMKFGGRIWDKKDDTTTKRVKAQSYAKDLNNFKITVDTITKTSIASVSRGAVGGLDAYYTGNSSPSLDVDPTATDVAGENHASIQGLYVLSTTANQVTQYSLTGNTWDLSSAVEYSPARSFSVNSQDTQPKGLSVRASGDYWYMAGDVTNTIYHYSMGTPWDISTSSLNGSNSYNFSAQTTTMQGCHVNTTHMYICSSTHVYEYSLSTSWNPSTATYVTSLDVSSQDNGMRGMDFDINGEHMYLVGTTNDKIYHYELSTAWDLSTAVLSDEFDGSSEFNEPKGVFHTGSDDRVIVMDSENEIAFKYQQRANHAFAAANRYGSGEMDDIIADLINNIDPTFIIRTLSTMPAQWTGTFLADGTFSEVVNLLLVRGDLTFYVNARKVLIIEKSPEFALEQKTNHQFYQIDPNVNTKTAGGQNLGGTAGVFHSYKISAIEQNDGKLINEITLLGARDRNGTVQFTNSQNVSDGDVVHSLRINVPQIGNTTDLDNVRDAILNLSNSVKPQYSVESPINIQHIRFNHVIQIINEMIGINTTTVGYVRVESIESNYPSGKTILTVNEFPINFFELSRTETVQVEGLQSDTAIPVVFLPTF